MSRVVQAVKHYGCRKQRYKFEMHIHRVILTSEKRKLFTRVLWTRGKKHDKKHAKNQRFRTKWCEGVENYNLDDSVFHTATIYFTSNTNQVQSKATMITLQIRERIDSKDVKYAKFELDLSKYVDVSSPHRVFHQRLIYEKARKKAQLIFTIKSFQLTADGNISDYTDNEEDEDDDASQSQSHFTDYDDDSALSVTTINTLQNAQISKKTNAIAPHTQKPHKTNINPLAIHSNISGQQLKHRNYKKQVLLKHESKSNENVIDKEQSPTPSSVSTKSAITITRRGSQSTEKFVRHSQIQQLTPRHHLNSSGSHHIVDVRPQSPTTHDHSSSLSEIDIVELKRKLKLFEDKHKKYKYKYARLCKKVEEQDIERQCQKDEICRLKRVEEDMKEQHHMLGKYRKKIKSLSKEREALKKTLQKRNQTIINLNKENSRLKQQIVSLQTADSVRYNSDIEDNISEFNDDEENKDNKDSTQNTSVKQQDEVAASQGVYILTAHKVDHTKDALAVHDGEARDDDQDSDVVDALETKEVNETHQKEETPPITFSVNTTTRKDDDIALPADVMKSHLEKELMYKLSATQTIQHKETSTGYGDGEIEDKAIDRLSPEIMRLLERKQLLMQHRTMDTKNLSEVQKKWMLAETEKSNYKTLYDKERLRVNHYKSKTESVNQKYEKAEIELSISRHQHEELQQRYEVMEEVYIKLKQDLTKMMDRYSKLEHEHERMHNKMRQSGQCFIGDDENSNS